MHSMYNIGRPLCITLFTQSKTYLNHDRDLDRYPDVYTRLHGTSIFQYKKAHHIVIYCSVIVTLQSKSEIIQIAI